MDDVTLQALHMRTLAFSSFGWSPLTKPITRQRRVVTEQGAQCRPYLVVYRQTIRRCWQKYSHSCIGRRARKTDSGWKRPRTTPFTSNRHGGSRRPKKKRTTILGGREGECEKGNARRKTDGAKVPSTQHGLLVTACPIASHPHPTLETGTHRDCRSSGQNNAPGRRAKQGHRI